MVSKCHVLPKIELISAERKEKQVRKHGVMIDVGAMFGAKATYR